MGRISLDPRKLVRRVRWPYRRSAPSRTLAYEGLTRRYRLRPIRRGCASLDIRHLPSACEELLRDPR